MTGLACCKAVTSFLFSFSRVCLSVKGFKKGTGAFDLTMPSGRTGFLDMFPAACESSSSVAKLSTLMLKTVTSSLWPLETLCRQAKRASKEIVLRAIYTSTFCRRVRRDRPWSPFASADHRLHSIVPPIPICSSQTYTRRLATPGEIFVHRACTASWSLALLMASVTVCAGETKMVVLAESALEKKPPAASDLARQEVEGEHLKIFAASF